MPHWGKLIGGASVAGLAYVAWRKNVTERALEHHYPKYKRYGWDIRRGWYLAAPPRTIEKDGIVYEETDETRPRASVDFCGNVKPIDAK